VPQANAKRLPRSATAGMRVAVLVMTLAISGTAWAADNTEEKPQQRLRSLQQEISKAEGEAQDKSGKTRHLKSELAKLRKKMVRAARLAQDKEQTVTELENRLENLSAQEKTARASLAHRKDEMAATLAALQILGRQPAVVMVARPGEVVDNLRAAMQLGAMTPRLRQQASELGQEIAALEDLQLSISGDRTRLETAHSTLEAQRTELAALVKRKSTEHSRSKDSLKLAKKRSETLAREAHDLVSLINRLDAEAKEKARQAAAKRTAEERSAQKKHAKDNDIGARFAKARGTLPLPVRGKIVQLFGETDINGLKARGLTVETRAQGQVVAPFDGEIVFAGPFRSYGQILIIAHGQGYHTLLAGLSRIDGTVGQRLLAGEPVGLMGRTGEKSARPQLYVEMRQSGKPIDPIPWLAAEEGRVRG